MSENEYCQYGFPKCTLCPQIIDETGEFKYIQVFVPKRFSPFRFYSVSIMYSASDGTCWENTVIVTLHVLLVKWFEADWRSTALKILIEVWTAEGILQEWKGMNIFIIDKNMGKAGHEKHPFLPHTFFFFSILEPIQKYYSCSASLVFRKNFIRLLHKSTSQVLRFLTCKLRWWA